MRNTGNLRPGGPGRPKGSRNKLTHERTLLQLAEKRFNSREYWEQSAWPRIVKGKAPHLEVYLLQRIYGRPVESVPDSGEPKKPIRVSIEVVRNEPLSVPAGPDKPALPSQLMRLPFRGGDGDRVGQAPIDVDLDDRRYRAR